MRACIYIYIYVHICLSVVYMKRGASMKPMASTLYQKKERPVFLEDMRFNASPRGRKKMHCTVVSKLNITRAILPFFAVTIHKWKHGHLAWSLFAMQRCGMQRPALQHHAAYCHYNPLSCNVLPCNVLTCSALLQSMLRCHAGYGRLMKCMRNDATRPTVTKTESVQCCTIMWRNVDLPWH